MAAVLLRMLAVGLLLLLTSLPYGQPQGENVLYVKPSTPDTQCPEGATVCLTLSEYAKELEQYIASSAVLNFLHGDHELDTNFTVTNITTLSLLATSASETSITCTAPVAFVFEGISDVNISGLTFINCGSDHYNSFTSYYFLHNHYCDYDDFLYYGNKNEIAFAAIVVRFAQHFELSNCVLRCSRNSTVSADNSNITLINSVFEYNRWSAVFTSSIVFLSGNVFHGNRAHDGGAVWAMNSSITFTGENSLTYNAAEYGGGAIWAMDSSMTFNGSNSFSDNAAEYGGGAIWAMDSPMTFIGSNSFRYSRAEDGGGAIWAMDSPMTFIGNNNFWNNRAKDGGAIWASDSVITVTGNFGLTYNAADFNGGGIRMSDGSITFNGNSSLVQNMAGFAGGGIFAEDSNGARGRDTDIQYSGSTNIHFLGSSRFEGNLAFDGGGLAVVLANVTFDGECNFTGNMARNSAGNGGGIYAQDSSNLHFKTNNIIFTYNSAANGGGLYLSPQCKLYIIPGTTRIDFVGNNAQEKGGALYVEDSNPLAYCRASTVYPGCFFELILEDKNTTNISEDLVQTFFFRGNKAKDGGSSVYGGAVDFCQLTGPYSGYRSGEVFDHLVMIEGDDPSSISSDPLSISVCDHDVNCTCPPTYLIPADYTSYNTNRLCLNEENDFCVLTFPGASFNIQLQAVGQRNGPVSALIQSAIVLEIFLEQVSVKAATDILHINSNCTELKYSIIIDSERESFYIQSQIIILYAEEPCITTSKSVSLKVTLLPCPPGFDLSENTGECICDKRLRNNSYTENCYIDDRTIQRQGVFWVGFDYHGDYYYDYSNIYSNYRGLILHPHCPFDYCKPGSEIVNFTQYTDSKQCKYNRYGLICGACRPGQSLILGNSHCHKCSNKRLALLIPFALAGVALVVLLLVCKLTVAAGTINGLIFYANIIASNRAIFFPNGDMSIFIAWLNLDLGIETCFYDGMDSYARTWLQFLFPLYIWTLIALIILGSKYSQKITKLMGTNPVAVLATLFILSYAKVLRTIIAALSFTTLHYPKDETKYVWLYDGNVPYFSGEHIVLFVFSLLVFLCLFLPYTLLLVSYQWLQAFSHLKPFSWVSSPRLKSFMDAYNAPYKPKARYWTGFLLLVRCALLLTFLLNYERDPSINLLAIIATCLGLTTLVWIKRDSVYNKWYLDALEGSFILNLGVLAAATYHIKFSTLEDQNNTQRDDQNTNQTVATYLSVGIAFMTFAMILTYHLYLQLKDTRIWTSMKSRFDKMKTMAMFHKKDYNTQEEDKETLEETTASTTSYVELRELLLEEN